MIDPCRGQGGTRRESGGCPAVPGEAKSEISMKKTKTKPKATPKETGDRSSRGQVVKLKPGKPRKSWSSRLPSLKHYWVQTKQFVVEAVQELKKTTWPNRKETLGTTGVVLVLVILIAIFLGLVDFGLSRLVHMFIY
jgi:preprotein translocase subunit SecE